ncbi:MAG: cupin domain-containing protein [Verrucomicrobia bacterium]|nr:cupin domain-containing protein [Verrucomicrobiota bacterium]
MIRVPPKARHCPFHSHATEWEFCLMVSGTGLMRLAKKSMKIRAGDCLLNPPGEAHQLINTGRKDLVCYVVANNAPADVWHYPDAKKWGWPIGRAGFFFRRSVLDDDDGEE